MTITPNGYPAWLRTAAHTDYGGHTDKRNWMSQGVVNGRTDVGAEAFARMVADLAAVARVAPFATLRVQCNDTSPAAPTILVCHQMTGIRETSYAGDAAPAGFPSAARNGNGDVTLTWASSYTDPYGVSGAVNIKNCVVTPVTNAARVAAYELPSAVSVRVRIFVSTSGAAATDPIFSLKVFTGGS